MTETPSEKESPQDKKTTIQKPALRDLIILVARGAGLRLQIAGHDKNSLTFMVQDANGNSIELVSLEQLPPALRPFATLDSNLLVIKWSGEDEERTLRNLLTVTRNAVIEGLKRARELVDLEIDRMIKEA